MADNSVQSSIMIVNSFIISFSDLDAVCMPSSTVFEAVENRNLNSGTFKEMGAYL